MGKSDWDMAVRNCIGSVQRLEMPRLQLQASLYWLPACAVESYRDRIIAETKDEMVRQLHRVHGFRLPDQPYREGNLDDVLSEHATTGDGDKGDG